MNLASGIPESLLSCHHKRTPSIFPESLLRYSSSRTGSSVSSPTSVRRSNVGGEGGEEVSLRTDVLLLMEGLSCLGSVYTFLAGGGIVPSQDLTVTHVYNHDSHFKKTLGYI